MKYRFTVTYIPAEVLKVNEQMGDLFPDFGSAAIQATLEVFRNDVKTLDQVKQDVVKSFEGNKHKVLTVEGGAIG